MHTRGMRTAHASSYDAHAPQTKKTQLLKKLRSGAGSGKGFKKLEAVNKHLGPDAIRDVGRALAVNTRCVALDLSSNDLSGCARDLEEMLRQNRALETITLKKTNISVRCAQVLN
jgi:hypothetical protein